MLAFLRAIALFEERSTNSSTRDALSAPRGRLSIDRGGLSASRGRAGNVDFASIVAGSDNVVVPRVFAADEDVVHIPGLGHVGLLFSPTVFRAVAERLRRPAGTRATVS